MIKKYFIKIFRKIGLLFLDIALNYHMFYKVIGMLNKGKYRIKTIFVAYPGSERYANEYSLKVHRATMNWRLIPVGFFKQGGRYGVMFACSNTEADFENINNLEKLKKIVKDAERIQHLLGASEVKFSGRLPGLLLKHNVSRNSSSELETTIQAVKQAIIKILELENYKLDTPIILLGGMGFIGNQLINILSSNKIYVIDAKGNTDWPDHFNNRPTLLLNLAGQDAITQFRSRFWKELIIVNESYPGIKKDDLVWLKNQGIIVYHISGVKPDFCFPAFPHPYKGSIPCCAAHLDPELSHEIITKKLT